MSTHQIVHPPSAYRGVDGALVAGVCVGLAAQFRIPVWVIRVVFIVACTWKFSGAVAYALVWLILPSERQPVPIGLVAAARQGLRTVARPWNWRLLIGWVASFAVGMGIAVAMRWYDHSVIGQCAVVICLLGLGVGLVWRVRESRWRAWAKVAVMVVAVALIWVTGAFLATRLLLWPQLDENFGMPGFAPDRHVAIYTIAGITAGLTIIAGAVVVLPWIIHPVVSEEAKQAELIAQTRADIAAHLHDSVLQTLAVIQKQAGDPKKVTQLARSQERELREWLYGDQVEDESATTALKEVVAELEKTYPVAVELVTVGDHEMTVEVDAIVRAAREAILNAAKHSGADKVDVYAEVNEDAAQIYVRDRGAGFVTDDIGEDRMGIRGSIIDRMTRYGGKVEIRSTVGEGTEIQLLMPLSEKGANNG
ncbi:MAG: PspC domain-containing protein [Propionibacteriaceae bacterium]|nr:PspC domain-containing protein [Propionibacteriaceae bacterium]